MIAMLRQAALAPGRPRLVAALVLVGASGLPIGLGLLFPQAGLDLVTRIAQACADLGPLGGLLLCAAQAVIAASGILPASLLGVAAGSLFGTQTGFLLAAAGTMAGAVMSFAFGRAIRPARPHGAPRGRLAGLDRSLAREGWRVVCLLRLSPIMPFAPTSYALSLSSVRFADYVIGTIASLPALLAYVMIGALGRSGGLVLTGQEGEAAWLRLMVLVVGIAATFALMVKLRRLLSRNVAIDPAETGETGSTLPLPIEEGAKG